MLGKMGSRELASLGAATLSTFSEQLVTGGRGVFRPTATTAALLQSAKNLKIDGSLLDLGCGWGIVGLELALWSERSFDLSMSDLSQAAVSAARTNARTLGIGARIQRGDGLEPWRKDRFDLVIADVSGVSELCPAFSRWFDDIPANTGPTGHNETAAVMVDLPELLTANGSALVPLISLSNREEGLRHFYENFFFVRRVKKISWLLRGLENSEMAEMHNQRRLGNVDFKLCGDALQCWTEVYMLSNDRIGRNEQ